MRLAVVSSYNTLKKHSVDDFLHDLSGATSFLIARELLKSGYETSFFFRANANKVSLLNGIKVVFMKDSWKQKSLWYVPDKLHDSIIRFQPDIIHIEGMIFPLQTFVLFRKMSTTTTMFVQNHAEQPGFGPLLLFQYLFFRQNMHFLFTATGQEKKWIRWGVIKSPMQIHYVMEGSNNFNFEPRLSAREKTGLYGLPVFIWIGNLNKNKDPITVLEGFNSILKNHSNARLYMIYKDTGLLKNIQNILNGNSMLNNAVRLIGAVEHGEIEDYLNSSDYILAGSHKEGSGYAVAEAMACGVVPIVTNIPSFYMMTNEGRIGALWEKSSPESLAEAIEIVLKRSLLDESQKTLAFFNKNLTSFAIAKKLDAIYRKHSH